MNDNRKAIRMTYENMQNFYDNCCARRGCLYVSNNGEMLVNRSVNDLKLALDTGTSIYFIEGTPLSSNDAISKIMDTYDEQFKQEYSDINSTARPNTGFER